jgi:hypothetical protein
MKGMSNYFARNDSLRVCAEMFRRFSAVSSSHAATGFATGGMIGIMPQQRI